MLGVKAFNWRFIATESSKPSIKTAKKIIKKNNLEEYVQVKRVKSGILQEITENFQVSICNPPFFDSPQGTRDGFEGLDDELYCSGGDVKFIKQYITESWALRSGKMFTSIVGIKSHLIEIQNFLNRNFPSIDLQETTLFQGRTIRWAIAWKFNLN